MARQPSPATHRPPAKREENLVRLEAELEELHVAGFSRIPRHYAGRLQELLADVTPEEAQRVRPLMSIEKAIGIIFDDLMEQPPQEHDPKPWDCWWCGGPKPIMRQGSHYCSDDHERRSLALEEEWRRIHRGPGEAALRPPRQVQRKPIAP